MARHVGAVLASVLMVAAPVTAQQFEILHAFAAPLTNARAPMVLASDGALYGAFASGGAGGSSGGSGGVPSVVSCGEVTCGTNQYCRASCNGTAGFTSTAPPSCWELPPACNGVATCECVCGGTSFFCTGTPFQCGCG